jgi:hypothetical protein
MRNRNDTITYEAPLPVAPFETGFAGASVEDICLFFQSYTESDAFDKEMENHINPLDFILLDERSAHDKTAVVAYCCKNMLGELEERREWIEELAIKTWKSWRIPMRTAFGVTSLLEIYPQNTIEMFEQDGPDKEGVYHYQEIEEEIDEYEMVKATKESEELGGEGGVEEGEGTRSG